VHFDESAPLRVCLICRRAISARLCLRGSAVVSRVEALPLPRPSALPAWAVVDRLISGNAGLSVFKPVIYLYAARPTVARVAVRLAAPRARFTALLPSPALYGGAAARAAASWTVRAHADGTLERAGEEQEVGGDGGGGGGAAAAAAAMPPVASLFWEGADVVYDVRGASPAACLRGAAAGDWLLRALANLGLSPREYTECASFWLPKMQEHAFVLIAFVPQSAIEAAAPLSVTPPPTATLRVFLVWQALDAPRQGASDALPPRHNFDRSDAALTVVEWGGAQVHDVL
jgi:hypothetical protein